MRDDKEMRPGKRERNGKKRKGGAVEFWAQLWWSAVNYYYWRGAWAHWCVYDDAVGLRGRKRRGKRATNVEGGGFCDGAAARRRETSGGKRRGRPAGKYVHAYEWFIAYDGEIQISLGEHNPVFKRTCKIYGTLPHAAARHSMLPINQSLLVML